MSSLVFVPKLERLRADLNPLDIFGWFGTDISAFATPSGSPLGGIEFVFGKESFKAFADSPSTAFGATFLVQKSAGIHEYTAVAAQYIRWYGLDFEIATAIVAYLNTRKEIEFAYVEGRPEVARTFRRPSAAARPFASGDLRSRQTYLNASPSGIGIDGVLRQPNAPLAKPIWGADIEFDWNFKHQEFQCLTERRGVPRAPSGLERINHGTAAIAIGIAAADLEGTRGIAPHTTGVRCFSIGDEPREDSSVAKAIDLAATELQPCDVLMIQVQLSKIVDGKPRYLPVECDQAVLFAIKRAVTRGITVIEPAGNGGYDLNRLPEDLVANDSGAIMVGAGIPPDTGSTWSLLAFSNRGDRVDVLAQGRGVYTCGYGDIANRRFSSRGSDWYTAEFGGTSSASAIVWGLCLLVQQMASERGMSSVEPALMRDAIRSSAQQVIPPYELATVGCPDLASVLMHLRIVP